MVLSNAYDFVTCMKINNMVNTIILSAILIVLIIAVYIEIMFWKSLLDFVKALFQFLNQKK